MGYRKTTCPECGNVGQYDATQCRLVACPRCGRIDHPTSVYRALRDCLPHYQENNRWYDWLNPDNVTGNLPKRLTVGALCSAWNHATAPYLSRTESEHRAYNRAARLIMSRLRSRHAGEYQEDEDGRLYVPLYPTPRG